MNPKQYFVPNLVANFLALGRIMRKHIKPSKDFKYTTLNQLEALGFIFEEGNASMKKLANYLAITPASATSIVDKLLEQGLIKRVEDNRDRRLVRIGISKRGENMVKRHLNEVEKKIKIMFKKLEIKSQKQLVIILNELQEAYKK